ncbi:MAG: hypothetical protein A2268_07070 [Candidatus Raymondbacteria bacterium RifOxyA12_full_50_37]|nr:MAG: hypothetical protein A2350_20855 [Candidatus Raymondbacteria bacterium RifOxyB12_full_50_8]OGJ89737.1 MAG: hypothetical protein A2268_07070 [Candidatus Raymondbacteria bacterium RifOxyA12_full_50_37]OGJ91146.1 MAG: hypothetical protein A2248_01220 [Candidatus Raymondbacteria bacterium RIFOXYA2_FULL_49_16]OGJ95186.1 MAG: hypothetical protein A2487_12400 [Candidatus Raymondbacteria bacterium RifOxyC12_full_50_8]OGJ97544.1 MAG: hypothetical protein A2453_01985 [Candidatus Raymondbacteria b
MKFTNVISRNRAVQALETACAGTSMHHAYLLTGPEGVGKFGLALEASLALLCRNKDNAPCRSCVSCRKLLNYNHPDFRLIFPYVSDKSFRDVAKELGLLEKYRKETGLHLTYEDIYVKYYSEAAVLSLGQPFRKLKASEDLKAKNREIFIDVLRQLADELTMPPSESSFKAVIIAEADLMNTEAANAFLKTLEEPRPHVRFFLCTSRPHALLATVRSRCQELKFPELSEDEIAAFLIEREGTNPDAARQAARAAMGSLSGALEYLDPENSAIRDEAAELVRCIEKNDSADALTLAARFSKTQLPENLLRLRFAAQELRQRPDMFPKVLPKITAALYALERKGQPELVHTAFFLGALEAARQ